MATNLNIRLQLKYDSFANWEKVKDTFTPLKGEVCIVNPGTSLSNRADTPCLMKVGDGETVFADLPWLSALAADVNSWAKKTASEFATWATDNGETYADSPKLATKAEVATVASNLAALTTRVTTAEGKITTIESDLNTAETGLKAKVTTLEDEMDDAEDRLTILEMALGVEGEGDNTIGARLSALEANDLKQDSDIAANKTAHETNAAAIAKLNGDATTEGSVAKAVADAVAVEKGRAEGVEAGLQDAIDIINGTAETEGSIAKAVAAEATLRESAVQAVDTKVTNLATEVAGVKTTANAADILSKANKAAIDVLNGVTAEGAGDTGKSVRAIAAEELAKQLIPEGAQESLDTLTEIATWIQEHPDDVAEMNAQIQENASKIAALEGTDKTQTADIAALKAAVGTLPAEGEKSLVEQIAEAESNAKAYAETKASEAQAAAVTAANEYTDDAIAEVESAAAALTSRVTAVETKAGNNETAITEEVARAKAAEEANATAISDEVTRAKAAEEANATAIATEKSRAESAEAGLQTNINNLEKKALIGTLDTSTNKLTIALNGQDLDLVFDCGSSTVNVY